MTRKVKHQLMHNFNQKRQKQQSFSIFDKIQFLYFDAINELTVADSKAIAAIIAGATYFAITQSSTVYLFLTCFLVAVAIKLAADFIPGSGRIKPWYLLGFALTISSILSIEIPANAQFFDALEQGVTDVVSEGDTGINESIIATMFTFFRIIVVLAFVIGVVVVLAQAFRGNDFAPIANMLGVGIAFVIVVELITNLMLGTGG